MCANSEGSGETARMRRLARAFAGRLCDKYHSLMSYLKSTMVKACFRVPEFVNKSWYFCLKQVGRCRRVVFIGPTTSDRGISKPNTCTANVNYDRLQILSTRGL